MTKQEEQYVERYRMWVADLAVDKLITHASSLTHLSYMEAIILKTELLKRLEIAMDILLHDSQQQSNH